MVCLLHRLTAVLWVLCCVCCQEDQVRKVGLSRYSRVSRTAFGLNGKKRIAVLRAGGAILGECCLPYNLRDGQACKGRSCGVQTIPLQGVRLLSLQTAS